MKGEKMDNRIVNLITEDVICTDASDISDKDILLEQLELLNKRKLNIMFVGATGVGKSSTINAIFNTSVARVGYGSDPETAGIQKYEFDNLTLWDTPGLGDSPEKDKQYACEIVNALKTKDENGDLLIDSVIVILDGSSRDMKTTYEVIEHIILPYIGDEKRIVIAINQCDMALKGRYWNYDENQPEEVLINFLDEKVQSVKNRVFESTRVSIIPIYYSALYRYNISKLLLELIQRQMKIIL